jgi:hypothetical protein
MRKPLMLGGLLGGLVAFAWGAFSWSVLPFHNRTLLQFKDEPTVSRVIAEQAPVSGVYGVPSPDIDRPGMSRKERKAAMDSLTARSLRGPNAFMAVQLGSLTPIGVLMGRGLAISILGALLITWIVLQTGAIGFVGRVRVVATAALVAGVLGELPNWNWWGFSNGYTIATLADLVIGWFLAGLVIARVTTGRTRRG